MSKLTEITNRIGELLRDRETASAELETVSAEAGRLVADGQDAGPVITRRQQLLNKLDAIGSALSLLRDREADARRRIHAENQRKVTRAATLAVNQAHGRAAEVATAADALFDVLGKLEDEMSGARQLVRQVDDKEYVNVKLSMSGIEQIAEVVASWRNQFQLM